MTRLEIDGERIDRERIRRQAALLREEAGRMGTLEEEIELTANAERLVIDHTVMDQEARRLGINPAESEVREALATLAPRSDSVAGCRAGAGDPALQAEVTRRLRLGRLLQH